MGKIKVILGIQGIIIGFLVMFYLLGAITMLALELEYMTGEWEYHEQLHDRYGELDGN
tara:strand:- start:20796 stop:20969 length:174 start_codon:yes stop_codon:yes gene_type:complete